MQRFKKEMLHKHRDFSVYGGQPGTNKHGKFVYGANGTLTQAARCRAGAMRILCANLANSFEPKRNLACAQAYIRDMREWGFHLPG